MMNLYELMKHFRLLSDLEDYSPEEREFLDKFLSREYALKEQKKREHLLRMSGIKRVKLLADFDWTFNPKVPREKIMEFMQTDWLKKPCNLVLIGPSGVGKSACCERHLLRRGDEGEANRLSHPLRSDREAYQSTERLQPHRLLCQGARPLPR